jgi:uncharacterized membrane protein
VVEEVNVQMMWGYGYDAWNWLWIPGMLLFWGGLAALAVWAVRTLAGSRATGDGALDTLRKRLAAGEITLEDYEKIKKVLG